MEKNNRNRVLYTMIKKEQSENQLQLMRELEDLGFRFEWKQGLGVGYYDATRSNYRLFFGLDDRYMYVYYKEKDIATIVLDFKLWKQVLIAIMQTIGDRID